MVFYSFKYGFQDNIFSKTTLTEISLYADTDCSPVRIASIASAVPDTVVSQSRALELIEKYYSAVPKASNQGAWNSCASFSDMRVS